VQKYKLKIGRRNFAAKVGAADEREKPPDLSVGSETKMNQSPGNGRLIFKNHSIQDSSHRSVHGLYLK
jgi:hypothetical protein